MCVFKYLFKNLFFCACIQIFIYLCIYIYAYIYMYIYICIGVITQVREGIKLLSGSTKWERKM
jgi:hypothetical protein